MSAKKPLPTLTEKDIKRFWSNVTKTDGCWLWTTRLSDSGYGIMRFHFEAVVQKVYAHRLSYFIATGEDPGPLNVNHKCDVRNCVNPNHLWLGTQKENMQDAMDKRRSINSPSDIGKLNHMVNLLSQLIDAVAA
jgi:hypothetical protein